MRSLIWILLSIFCWTGCTSAPASPQQADSSKETAPPKETAPKATSSKTSPKQKRVQKTTQQTTPPHSSSLKQQKPSQVQAVQKTQNPQAVQAVQPVQKLQDTQAVQPVQAIQKTQNPPQILLLSDLIGYIEPCGCTLDLKLGGLDKTALLIEELRQKGPTLVLSVGSHLFEYPTVKDHLVAQDEAKAKLIRKIFKEIKVDAFIPGKNDLARGLDFYTQLNQEFPLNDVSVNRPQGQVHFTTLGSLKVALIGLLPTDFTHPLGKASAFETQLPTWIQSAHQAKADLVIVLASLPRAQLRPLAEKHTGVDLWILGNHPQEEAHLSPINGQKSFLIEAGDRGRNLAQIEIFQGHQDGPFQDPVGEIKRQKHRLKSQLKMKELMATRMPSPFLKKGIDDLKKKIQALDLPQDQPSSKSLRYRLLPIKEERQGHPLIQHEIQQYQASLKSLNLKLAGQVKPLPPGGNGYAGIKECELCHPSAVEFWKETKHSHAWETLVKADKTFDVECVGCHVAGWQKPGGSALGHTDRLKDVQCEACHGPSAKHAEVGGGEAYTRLKVPEAVCTECHNEHHSPKFNYESYLKKVIGPGHGKPLEQNQE